MGQAGKLGRPRIRYELPSSQKLLVHDLGDYEENTLVSLLVEAEEQNLPNNAKVKITGRTIDMRFTSGAWDHNPEQTLRYYNEWCPLQELKEDYQRMTGHPFSIANEEERSAFRLEALKNQANQIAGWAYFGIAMKEAGEYYFSK
ncbi:hypothetical protein K9M74_03135 [Candidatus Woesearchaeota archaeon]|nr:hypothetical protein [Candidatus Woesearchaeota archaeon]